MLFYTAFNTVFQRVSHMLKSHGYQFSDAEVIKLVLGYADDIANIIAKMQHNQEVIDVIQEWLEWSQTIKAKPRKCKCMCLAQGKPIDPRLTVAENL